MHWRTAGSRRHTAHCTALRITPALDHRHPRLLPEIWLLAERDVGLSRKTRFFYVNLPATASLAAVVGFAHQRWPIEQQYQELKSELGLDHFEGRTYPGWQHHVVLTAVAYNFLQTERQRVHRTLTFPMVRGLVQEIFTAYLFAQRPDTSSESRRSGPCNSESDKVVPERAWPIAQRECVSKCGCGDSS